MRRFALFAVLCIFAFMLPVTAYAAVVSDYYEVDDHYYQAKWYSPPMRHSLHTDTDEDWILIAYLWPGDVGLTYTVYTTDSDVGTGVDTVMELYWASSQTDEPILVGWNDDGGVGTYSRIDWVADRPGYLYARVDGYAGAMGDYEIAYYAMDRMPPVTEDDAPTGWVNSGTWVTLSAIDLHNAVSQTEYRVNSGPVQLYSSRLYFSAPGVWELQYRSADNVPPIVDGPNWEDWKSTFIRIDTAAPSTTDDAPSGWTASNVSVALNATDDRSGVSSTYYTVNGSAPALYTGLASLSFTTSGVRDIEYWSVDNANNTESTRQCSVAVDKTAPVVSTDAPSGWGASASVSIGATDAHSGVNTVYYSLDGGPTAIYTGSPITFPHEGVYSLRCWATDVVGNTCLARTDLVRVDWTPPLAYDNAYSGWYTQTPATFTISGEDSLSGVSSIDRYLGTWSSIPGASEQISMATDGVHTLTYRATDAAGNSSPSRTVTVRVDSVDPVTTIDAPGGWASGDALVSLVATDVTSGVDETFYRLDDGPVESYAGTIPMTTDGEHRLVFWSVDVAGNAEEPKVATVHIDGTAPAVSSDVGEAWQQGPVDVTITATDAGSGVASIDATCTDPAFAVTTYSAASGVMTFTLAAEGTTTVEFAATDAAGNSCASSFAMVRIDHTAPVVSISPTDTATVDTMTFMLSASDAHSGVASIWCAVDGGSAEQTDTVILDVVGDHTIEYWAMDGAGNESVRETHTVRVSSSLTVYTEVAGANRYTTAVEASRHSFPDGANALVLATGANWPDALGGAALAGVYEAPVLLTPPDALPQAVADEIVRLGPDHVFVLGGTAVVSEDVEAEVRALLAHTANLERFWGMDRFDTSNVIACRVLRESNPFGGTAFVATGRTFPDALAAAPLATALRWPLYLADGGGIAPKTLKAMLDAGVTHVVILGGDSAVPAGVEAQLDGASITHERVEGVDRYETAIEIASLGVSRGMTWDKSALACGTSFPDALSGGVMQGHDNAVLMLTRSDVLPVGVAAKLTEQRDLIGEVRFVGGVSAIEQGVRDGVRQLLR